MLIIVEGPDGSGKTTLVNDLSHAVVTPVVDEEGKAIKNEKTGWEHNDTQAEILHSGPLKQNPIVAYEMRLKNYDPFHDIVIADRWHVGELIYGPLLRGSSQLTPAMKRHTDLLLVKLGAVKVFMDTDFETTYERAYGRGEDLIPSQHARLVWDAYQEICTLKDNWLPASRFKLNVIVETARALTLKAQSLHRFKSYVGPINPHTLVLGGQPDVPRPGQAVTPWAFTPWAGSSGDYLLTTMEAAGCRSYGLADCKDTDIADLWATLDFPKIVLLGVEAELAMKKEDDVVQAAITRTLEHPRFVQQFKMGALHKYGQILKEAVNG